MEWYSYLEVLTKRFWIHFFCKKRIKSLTWNIFSIYIVNGFNKLFIVQIMTIAQKKKKYNKKDYKKSGFELILLCQNCSKIVDIFKFSVVSYCSHNT